jgi:hypothetical protein
MTVDTISLSAPVGEQTAGKSVPLLGIKLLFSMRDLSAVTTLSVRHLRRLDSSREIPGRVVSGRRVLFQAEAIREWARLGLPDAAGWPAPLHRAGRK